MESLEEEIYESLGRTVRRRRMREGALTIAFVVILFLFAVGGWHVAGCPDGELNYDHPGQC